MPRNTASPSSKLLPRGTTVLQVLPALKDGGVETSALEMALYLKAQGIPNLVASAGGERVSTLVKNGVPHSTLALNSKNPFRILANSLRIASIVNENHVTLIHARSRAPAWSAWLASLLTGVAYVTTFHGTYGLSGGPLKRLYNSVMLRGPVVIANSEFIRTHILENYHIKPDRIIVAPRGVDPTLIDPANFTKTDILSTREELNVSGTTPLILMAGRITRWKGHELLLEALAEIHDLNWILAVAGEVEKNSPFGDDLKRRAKELGISDRIRWLGSRNDVPRLLAASQLAVSASFKPEAFGRVAIESMAMGVPVVATGIGGSAETILDGKTGFLVEPSRDKLGKFGAFTPQAMASKLRGALQKPASLASMGQAARAHVLSRYTVANCCAAELTGYVRTLAARPPRQL